MSEPELGLDQKSDYILMDEQLIVDGTDLRCSDHLLVWVALVRRCSVSLEEQN